MRLEHVYEVDPDLMGKQFNQQNMPTWDTLRIVESRNTWHGCTSTSPTRRSSPGSSRSWTSGPASRVASLPRPREAPARHPKPILPY